jgi:uncharacterized membrane protein
MGRSACALVGTEKMRAKFLVSTVLAFLLGCGAVLAQESAGGLTVEVTSADGKPLPSACVTFVPKNGEVLFRKADNKGRVRLKELSPGSYRVVVKVEGYEAQKKEVTLGQSAEVIAFNLQPRRREQR